MDQVRLHLPAQWDTISAPADATHDTLSHFMIIWVASLTALILKDYPGPGSLHWTQPGSFQSVAALDNPGFFISNIIRASSLHVISGLLPAGEQVLCLTRAIVHIPCWERPSCWQIKPLPDWGKGRTCFVRCCCTHTQSSLRCICGGSTSDIWGNILNVTMLKNKPSTHHNTFVRDRLWDAGEQREIIVFVCN